MSILEAARKTLLILHIERKIDGRISLSHQANSKKERGARREDVNRSDSRRSITDVVFNGVLI
tara:strand:+ start:1984 stop:2172 length:189 start_codon:yes stop_codon:yes gene_type:complete